MFTRSEVIVLTNKQTLTQKNYIDSKRPTLFAMLQRLVKDCTKNEIIQENVVDLLRWNKGPTHVGDQGRA